MDKNDRQNSTLAAIRTNEKTIAEIINVCITPTIKGKLTKYVNQIRKLEQLLPESTKSEQLNLKRQIGYKIKNRNQFIDQVLRKRFKKILIKAAENCKLMTEEELDKEQDDSESDSDDEEESENPNAMVIVAKLIMDITIID